MNITRAVAIAAFAIGVSLSIQAQEADLAVLKDGPANANADTDVPYTVTLTNAGPDTAVNVVLSDPIPAGMTFVSESHDPAFSCTAPAPGSNGTVSCSTPALLPSIPANFTFVFHIAPGTPASTSFLNTATAVSDTFDPNDENNKGVAGTSTPPDTSNMGVTKSGPSVLPPDSDINYTISIANSGASAATSVMLKDTLPAPLTFVSFTQNTGPSLSCTAPPVNCTIASFAAGATATFTLVGHIPSGTAGGTEITNTATVSATNDPNGENDTSSSTVTVSALDISVTKSGPATANAGSQISYVLAIANAGPDAAAPASLSDPLPPGTTFVSFTQDNGPAANCNTPIIGTNGTFACTVPLGAQQSAQFTVTVAIGDATSLTNTVTGGASSSFDTNTNNNSASVTTAVTPVADLEVTKFGPPTVTAGTSVLYSMVVRNNGPSTASNVSLSDPAPPGTTFVSLTQDTNDPGPTFNCTGSTCTIASLVPGTPATFTLVLHVAPTAAGSISNTANVSTSTTDSNGSNDSSNVTSTVTVTADVAVTKSGPASVTAGTDVTYNITVTNNGPSTAANVSLSDPAPPNATLVSLTQNTGPAFNCTGSSCTIASLAPLTPAAFTLVLHVAPSATGSVSNTASVATTTTDSNGSNNMSNVTSTVTPSADVAVVKSGPQVAVSGNDVTYTLTATNSGPSDAANVSLTDTPGAGYTFVSLTQATGPAFNCVSSTCTIASFTAGSTATFTLVVHLAPAATGTVTNTATITTTTADPNSANNTSVVNTPVNTPPTDVQIVKTAGAAQSSPGATATYTLVVTNNGPATAVAVTVTDPLPPGSTYQSANATQGSCSGTTTVTCNVGTLTPNASATITIAVTLPSAVVPALANTATVSEANTDTNPTNNTSTTTIIVAPPNIPALSGWMLMLLACLLAAVALRIRT